MTVEGEDAFCVDINTNFRNGYKTRADASTRMSYDQISDVALSIEYVNQYVQSHSGLSSQHIYLFETVRRMAEIEAGKVTLTDDMQDKLMEAVEKFNPDAPMFLLFDYVRIRFPTLDIQHVIKDILKLNMDYMLHEDYGHYKYTEHYYLGDVFVYTSQDEEKGTLLELKGKGCRQFESYLLAQERSWYDFLMDALVEGGVMKRLDLAINDRAGILDIQI